MQRRLGATIAVAMLALASVGVLGSPAGAQSQEVFSCTYVVSPTTLPPGGGFILIEGTAPGTSVARIFVNGFLAATVNTAPVTGAFSASIFITASVEISIALDDYPNSPCIGTGGSGANQGQGGSASGVRVGVLPRTGSSDTKTFVLVGLVLLSVGLVLVVAARRRSSVNAPV